MGPSPAPDSSEPPPRLWHSSRRMHRDFRERLKRGDNFKTADDDDDDTAEGATRDYFKDYLRFMNPFRWQILSLLGMSFIVAVLDMLVPLATGKLVDNVLQNQALTTSDKARWLTIICPALLLMMLVGRGIEDFTLTVPGGSTVALAGASGAGKSTLADLAARFYTPVCGTILLNGHDVRQIKLHSFRRMLGIVSQEVFLFDGTVAENICR